MRRLCFLSFLAPLALVPACPSTSETDAGADSPGFDGGGVDGGGVDGGGVDGGGVDGGGVDGGGVDGGGVDGGGVDGGGGSGAMGDCVSDTDCPTGGRCIELVPGGYRVCQTPVTQATTCEAGRFDECCMTSECTGTREICVLGPVRRFCGGAKRLPFNECAADECVTSADCRGGGPGEQVCAPAGTLGPVRLCVTGTCLTDADCDASPNGHCVVYTDPCCGVRNGLFCTYGAVGGGTACRSSADCPVGYCGIDGSGVSSCRDDGGPICPG